MKKKKQFLPSRNSLLYYFTVGGQERTDRSLGLREGVSLSLKGE